MLLMILKRLLLRLLSWLANDRGNDRGQGCWSYTLELRISLHNNTIDNYIVSSLSTNCSPATTCDAHFQPPAKNV